MLSNFHTHTTFSDGKNTVEEVVVSAIEKGFSAIGFTDHGYTDFDLSYCIKDLKGYIEEVNRLKEKYSNKLQIYLGLEEDGSCLSNRSFYEYIIGSLHYFKIDGKYYPIDSSYQGFKNCLNLFDNDLIKMANNYYSTFCDYVIKRKPEIIGHFDLITKYDEKDGGVLLNNKEYNLLAEKYLNSLIKTGSLFEVNTGAISRGYRTKPYPNENLLYILKKNDVGIILTSDSHTASNIDFAFEETKKYLKDVGFDGTYTIKDNKFTKVKL